MEGVQTLGKFNCPLGKGGGLISDVKEHQGRGSGRLHAKLRAGVSMAFGIMTGLVHERIPMQEGVGATARLLSEG